MKNNPVEILEAKWPSLKFSTVLIGSKINLINCDIKNMALNKETAF